MRARPLIQNVFASGKKRPAGVRPERVPDLVRQRLPDLYRLARGVTGDTANAEDLVHDSCVKTLLVLSVGWMTVLLAPIDRPDPGGAAATALVNEFHTFVISRRDLDYPHPEPRAIREWFSDKVDFRVPLPIRPDGLDLSGGRLCNLLDQRIVSFMYLASDAWISLYILKPIDARASDAQPGVLLLRGYGYIQWVHDGLQYSLVGDIPVEQLRRFAGRLGESLIARTDPADRRCAAGRGRLHSSDRILAAPAPVSGSFA